MMMSDFESEMEARMTYGRGLRLTDAAAGGQQQQQEEALVRSIATFDRASRLHHVSRDMTNKDAGSRLPTAQDIEAERQEQQLMQS